MDQIVYRISVKWNVQPRTGKAALSLLRIYNNLNVQDAKLVVVRSCGSRLEADLAKGALEEADIDAIIQGDTAGGMREHLAWSGAGFKILVREDDATAARNVLASLAEGDETADADPETDDDLFPPWRRFS
jgi:hypothetical protein